MPRLTRKLLKAHELTMTAVAAEAGVTVSFVSDVCRGHRRTTERVWAAFERLRARRRQTGYQRHTSIRAALRLLGAVEQGNGGE